LSEAVQGAYTLTKESEMKTIANIFLRCHIVLCIVCGTVYCTESGAVDSTGIHLLHNREDAKAQAFFEAAVKKNPDDAESFYYLAASLQRQHKTAEAQDAIEVALEKNDAVSKYHFLRGAILGEKAMNANVISQGFLAPKIKNAFLRAAELDPQNADAHIGLFNYYLQAPGIMGGSEEKAFAEAGIVRDLDPYRGHMMLAGYYAKKNDKTNAETEYKKAIGASPKKPEAYYQLGMFLNKQQRTDEAVVLFKTMIDNDPKDFDCNYFYGRAMFNLERWDQAIEKFQYALFLDKDNSASIWMLANCYEKKGMTVKAKETYQWLLRVDPSGRRAESAKEKVKELQ
jgi:cytochrome c-type biogenesis protein CcmH/NrfG